MIICGVDLETTGLSPDTDVVTEVGAILWDTELNQPIKFFNKLLKINCSVPSEIVKLTGITDNLLQTYGEPPSDVWAEFKEFQSKAEIFIAHNAPFDKGFIEKHCGFKLATNLWIDSVVDIPYLDEIKTRKLTYLAAEHGFVNPFAHRAISDVMTMFQVVSRYDWKKIVESAKTPNITLRALVTHAEKDKAKLAGFYWNGTAKIWAKQVKEFKLNEEINKCREQGFLVKVIG